MTPVERSILETLAYFAQFERALSGYDLHQYLWDKPVFRSAVDQATNSLIKRNVIVQQQGLYALSAHSLKVTLGRQRLLEERRDLALYMAEVLQRIPGIRSVILQNSTAMQTLKPQSDIDLLVITDSKTLYSTRAAAIINLEIRGLNKRKGNQAGKACLGYWLTDHLDLQKYQTEQHTAAYWLATMVPLVGLPGYQKLIDANRWVKDSLPNWMPHTVAHLPERPVSSSRIFTSVEPLLYRLSKAKVLRDPEFKHSHEMVCTPTMLKLHSIDKRPSYGHKMQSILDILYSKS